MQTYGVHDYYQVHSWIDSSLEPAGVDRSQHYSRCIIRPAYCSSEEWERLAGYYEEEVEHLDRGFGRLLRAIEARDRGPTYLIVVSDHGEGFDLETERFHHGGRLHDDLIRVPLLLAGPDLTPGRVERPVSLVDIAPTLLALAGTESVEGLDGRSLLDGADEGDERMLYAFEHMHVWRNGTRLDSEAVQERPRMVAVIDGDQRLLADREEVLLYSALRDPGQKQPLDPWGVQEVLPMLKEAHRLLRYRTRLHLFQHGEALNRELRSLGYL